MTPLFLKSRASGHERLDEPHHDRGELRVNLHHLAGVNRWLGGERSVMQHLRPVAMPAAKTFRLLDVGAGGADLPRNIARYLVSRSLRPVVFALDRQPSVAAVAVERSDGAAMVHVLVGDGLTLPLPDDSVDVAISSTTLHHLSTEDAVSFVREMARVARSRVIVSDLDRNIVALVGANVLARTWWRRSVYRFDGPLSVRKAFTRSELMTVGAAAGLQSTQVHRHFPFRLALVGTPG